MPVSTQRVVSLLPSTTEIVAALGYGAQLVGRSHECDVPAAVQSLPVCTQPKFNPEGQSYQIDQRVKALLQEGLSVYRVMGEQLAELNPDLIITQDHCEVCAASVDEVKKAVRNYLSKEVNIVSVSPTNLREVYASIRRIAGALGNPGAGENLAKKMKGEFETLADRTSKFNREKILCIEWLNPLMTAGNWVPELADFANIEALAAEAGAHSPWTKWEDIRQLDPEAVVLMPCGYSISQTLSEMDDLTNRPGWETLQAIKNGRIFIADGHHYFNRPGPRLTDSARILSEIAHPPGDPTLKGKGWIHFDSTRV